jgi:hypothetical protein
MNSLNEFSDVVGMDVGGAKVTFAKPIDTFFELSIV